MSRSRARDECAFLPADDDEDDVRSPPPRASIGKVRTRQPDVGTAKAKAKPVMELVEEEDDEPLEEFEDNDPKLNSMNAALNQAQQSIKKNNNAAAAPAPSSHVELVDPQMVTAHTVKDHAQLLIDKWISPDSELGGHSLRRVERLGTAELKVDFEHFEHELFENNCTTYDLDIQTHLLALGKYRKEIGLEEAERLRGELSKVLKIFKKTCDTIRSAFDVTCETMKVARIDNSYLVPSNPGTLNPKQQLLFELYRQASLKGLRKRKGFIYEPIKSPVGLPTHAFKYAQTITQFILANCNRQHFSANWEVVTGKSFDLTIKDMSNLIQQMDDMEMQNLVPDRHKFAFKNGVFLTRLDKAYSKSIATRLNTDNKKLPVSEWYCKFIPYNNAEFAHVGEVKSAVNYFDFDMVDQSHIEDWYKIKTPTMQYILEYQLGRRPDAEEIIRHVYMNIGRAFFSRDDLEDWQFALYFKGLAGTGKSTIIEHFLKEIYPQDCRVEISNDISAQFGIGGELNNKDDIFLTTFGELDHTCQLSLTNVLQMISGEELAADVKHKELAVTKRWPSHCFFAGNSFPLNWTDKLGAITRRFLLLPFLYKVQRKDLRSDLKDLIRAELPALLQKCTRAYLECVNKNRSKNIWTFCPKIFHETKAQLQQQTNVLQSFMTDIKYVVVDNCFITSENDLLEEFKIFAKANNVSTKINSKDLAFLAIVQDLSETHGVTVEYKTIDSIQYNNAMVYNGQFFAGIGLTSRLTEEQKRKYLLKNEDLIAEQDAQPIAQQDEVAEVAEQSEQEESGVEQSDHEQSDHEEEEQSDHEEVKEAAPPQPKMVILKSPTGDKKVKLVIKQIVKPAEPAKVATPATPATPNVEKRVRRPSQRIRDQK